VNGPGRATMAENITGRAGPFRAEKGYGPGRAGLCNAKIKTGRAGPCEARAGPGRAMKFRPVQGSTVSQAPTDGF
jgi:hypothetical protein